MENKYEIGEVVYERIAPSLKLIVKSHHLGFYYCHAKEDATCQEYPYYEGELATTRRFEDVESSLFNYNMFLFK